MIADVETREKTRENDVNSRSRLAVSGPESSAPGGRASVLLRETYPPVLRLLPRDPEWVFAYWDVPWDNWREFSRVYGPGFRSEENAALRFHVGGNGAPPKMFDVGVAPMGRREYVHGPFNGGCLIAELGVRTPEGGFRRLLLSEEVRFPRGMVFDPKGESRASGILPSGSVGSEERPGDSRSSSGANQRSRQPDSLPYARASSSQWMAG